MSCNNFPDQQKAYMEYWYAYSISHTVKSETTTLLVGITKQINYHFRVVTSEFTSMDNRECFRRKHITQCIPLWMAGTGVYCGTEGNTGKPKEENSISIQVIEAFLEVGEE